MSNDATHMSIYILILDSVLNSLEYYWIPHNLACNSQVGNIQFSSRIPVFFPHPTTSFSMCLSGMITLGMIKAKLENKTGKKHLVPQPSLTGEWRVRAVIEKRNKTPLKNGMNRG